MEESSSLLQAAAALLFAVDLDGRSIGTHEFRLEPGGDASLSVRSIADFRVRVLGVPVYRYRHEAHEEWVDGCLRGLSASTDDDGRRTQVIARAARESASLTLRAGDASAEVGGCVRSFAYWRPEWLSSSTLLNPQTGRVEAARLTELGEEALELADGRNTRARRLRLRAGGLDIDLWYGGGGEWLQLVSTTKDGRRLRYRRQ